MFEPSWTSLLTTCADAAITAFLSQASYNARLGIPCLIMPSSKAQMTRSSAGAWNKLGIIGSSAYVHHELGRLGLPPQDGPKPRAALHHHVDDGPLHAWRSRRRSGGPGPPAGLVGAAGGSGPRDRHGRPGTGRGALGALLGASGRERADFGGLRRT